MGDRREINIFLLAFGKEFAFYSNGIIKRRYSLKRTRRWRLLHAFAAVVGRDYKQIPDSP